MGLLAGPRRLPGLAAGWQPETNLWPKITSGAAKVAPISSVGRAPAALILLEIMMSIRGIFVALVDDDEMLREALAGLLEISGMTVEQYDSGGQFLAAAANSKAACVIADIQLGDITGIEMARQLRASDFRFRLILMTGADDPIFERQAEELGCVAFLRKPFRSETLIKAIMTATASPTEKQDR
jgi:CheY-like chemotaxis protein